MAGQTNEQTKRPNPQLTDWLPAVIGTDPNNPQNGGTDALIQAQDLTELFFDNISTNQLNAIHYYQPVIRVAASGTVTMTTPGRAPITVQHVSTGVYELTAINGENIAAIIPGRAGVASSGVPRFFDVYPPSTTAQDAPSAQVRVMDENGAPVDSHFTAAIWLNPT